MALNLSTLTSPATSGNVLEEVTTTADFLESVPVLRNLARGTNAGGDATQSVALNQPKALPLIDGEGYLYLPQVGSNYASIIEPLSMSNAWTIEIVAWVTEPSQAGADQCLLGSADTTPNHTIRIRDNSFFEVCLGGFTNGVDAWRGVSTPSLISNGVNNIVITWNGTDTIAATLNGTSLGSRTLSAPSDFEAFRLGEKGGGTESLRGAYKKLIVTESGSEIVNCDFTATNVRHGDTEFTCATGQVVTINQSGNDPATVIKKPVLRFDGVGNFMDGVFNQTITDGYLFAAFSVLGDGGDAYGRIFSANSTGAFDYQTGGFALRRYNSTDQIQVRWNGGSEITHSDVFNGERGDFLLESPLRAGDQNSKINNADADDGACRLPNPVSSEEFKIAAATSQDSHPAIDLEYLALFPADSVPDEATASKIRNFINNRNSVFYRWDTDGYYFYDAQKAPVGNISSGSASWNGRIVGSDNGDTDKFATQATANDQPVGDGYVVTFAGTSDHLDIPSTTQAGWQVVGTSLGTFAYRVNANAVTELNLLGNLGWPTYRKTGDLYGIILLPETATGADIEAARKLLIDRGAADASTIISAGAAWFRRYDIVEFKNAEFPDALTFGFAFEEATNLSKISTVNAPISYNFRSSWKGCSSLTQFPQYAKLGTEATNVSFQEAWHSSGLTSFPALDLSNGNNFISAWQSCSALQSFPADAKLGTEASNVNFQDAWRSSGLTSFPALDLSNATSLRSTWRDCYDMLSFGLVQTSSVTNFSDAWLGCSSLTSFPLIDTSSGTNFYRTWYDMDSVTDFPLLNVSAGRNFSDAWRFCEELVNFPAGLFDSWNPASISSGVFHLTWDGCTSLTAQSVENILVSIAASGQFATVDGNSGGTALADAGIDITYNGDPLSAATTAAIDSLSGKGWQVYINGELVIPNILDLAPAAAYSLRSFDADADPNVVNVRRSSDGATSDFTASEVSDGTLTSWVNTDVVQHESDFTSGVDGYTFDTYGTIVSENSYEGQSNVLKYEKPASGRFGFKRAATSLNREDAYEITFDYYADPAFNNQFWGIESSFANSLSIASTNPSVVSGAWTSVTLNVPAGRASGVSSLFLRIQATANDLYGTLSAGSVRLKNVVVTQTLSNGHVTTWYDQSDNGNDSTQSTASAQPKIVDGGTLVTGGIDFGAQSDALYLEKNSVTSLSYVSLSSFVVASFNGNSGVGSSPLGMNTSPRYYMPLTRPDGIYLSYSSLETLKFSDNTTEPTSLFSAVSGASNTSAFFNGVSAGSVSSVSGNSIKIAIGYNTATAYHNGTIQEIIIYNSDQSANRTGIENNINDHFDIYS